MPPQAILPQVGAWVASAGLCCNCACDELPTKRSRGRPKLHADACRHCWRSLCADRDLPAPHNLSLASRCLQDHPQFDERALVEALKLALPDAGYSITRRTVRLPLSDGTTSPPTFGWFVFGWRDRRYADALYVQRSSIAGGGALAAIDLPKGTFVCRYTGVPVRAAQVRAPGFVRGYVLRVGPRYIDARDPAGRLRLSDGSLVDPHPYSDADWAALQQVGVAWEGHASLSRFVNHSEASNAVLSKGRLVTTTAVEAHSELLVRYGAAFWK